MDETETLPHHEIPALNGNSAPVLTEDAFDDLRPESGAVPPDLNGLYVRNGPNAVHPPHWRYHAYDGDGMLHAVRFDQGRVSYRNRWIRTRGLDEEGRAGRALWTGLKEPPRADRPDEPLKNTSNTDVKYHAGRLITTWYRAGLPYAVDPITLETLGGVDHGGPTSRISAHARPDEQTGELLFFDYGAEPPYLRCGVIGPDHRVRHAIEVPIDHPPLPHDMAITPHWTVLHDFPLRLDEAARAAGRYKIAFRADQPSRFALVPRYGAPSEVRWFEASPAYMLHVVNAWEEGSEVVMVGTPYRLHRTDHGAIDAGRLERTIHWRQRDFTVHEWRFDLATGRTRERVVDDVLNSEFPVINAAWQGRRTRWSYHVVFPPGGREEPRFPGLVKYDLHTGGYVAFSEGPGWFYNEPGFAPRDGARDEDDGWLVTIAWNAPRRRSEIQVFDARGPMLAHGPAVRIPLPRRVPHGFHATWVSAEVMARWPAPASAA